MELYYGAVEAAYHTIYLGDEVVTSEPSIDWEVTYLDGEPVSEGTASPDDNGRYRAVLDTDVTGDMRPKLIFWRYVLNEMAVTTPGELITIIRPYIDINSYNLDAGSSELTPSQFRPLEREVRNVIDSYCRQDFQLRPNHTYTVPGGSSNVLQLPDRLVRLNSIVAVDEPIALLPGYIGTYGEDSFYERQRADRLDVHTLDSYVTFDPTNPWEIRRRMSAEAPQGNPIQRYEFFKSGRRYSIHGDWGWEHVPSIVQQAAGILVKDYLDDDSKYREKWIDNVRAADWRMEFSATGSETTGHANVDMMLERFRNYRPEVV